MSDIISKDISDIISQIGPKNSLSKHVNYNTLLQLIVDEIRKLNKKVSKFGIVKNTRIY